MILKNEQPFPTVNNETIREHFGYEWSTIRDEILVQVSDGKIVVIGINLPPPKKMMTLEDSTIKKNELKALFQLKSLFVSGRSNGTVIIVGKSHSVS